MPATDLEFALPMMNETHDISRDEGVSTPHRITRPGARARVVGLFGLGVVAALFAVVLSTVLVPGPVPLTQRNVSDAINRALASQTPAQALSMAAYAAIQPSLVLIQAQRAQGTAGATSAIGSGVIIDDHGDILTSLHVVADATTIQVTFADGTVSSATVAIRTPDSDTAVLQAAELPAQVVPATLGNPRAVRVGTEAFVLGNPFGLDSSLSAGVVSGLGRTFQMPNGGPVLHDLIQVDAAVNPGNSGGPLVDRNGRVIGIVTGLVNPTAQDVFVGIGLAVPIDVAGGAAGLPQY